MKTVVVLSLVVVLLCGCSELSSPTQNVTPTNTDVTIINQPSFDCMTEDDYLVTTGDVFGYTEYNSEKPIVVLKAGFVLKRTDVYQSGLSPSATSVWYQVTSPYLLQAVWIDAYKGNVDFLPCAPLFVK